MHCTHESHFERPAEPKRLVISGARRGEFERSKATRDLITSAAEARKIFTIYGRLSYCEDIRAGLLRRGWVERPPPRECDTVNARTDLSGLRVVHKKRSAAAVPSTTDGDSSSEDDDDDGDGDDTDDDEPGLDPDAAAEAAWKRTAASLGNGEFSTDELTLHNTLSSFYPNLIWTPKQSRTISTKTLRDDQQVNAFRRNGCLSTKVGLTRTLQDVGLYEAASGDSFYPMCFNLAEEDDREGFLDYFLRISAMSILKRRTEWSVPSQLLLIAISILEEYLAERANDDIDTPVKAPRPFTPADCHALVQFVSEKLGDTFDKAPLPAVPLPQRKSLSESKRCVTKSEDSSPEKKDSKPPKNGRPSAFKRKEAGEPGRRHLFDAEFVACSKAGSARLAELCGINDSGTDESVAARCDAAIEQVDNLDPQAAIQGVRNVWIVKPGAKSRGRGIFCENRLDLILEAASNPESRERYVAQKYIEAPLMVHNTKFDIRQYFLVTSWNPLTVFVYKRSYLRFSSTEYDLTDLRSELSRFRHLCNNAIQKDAGVAAPWNEGHMWTSDEFQDWLGAKGLGSKWDDVIYPGIKDAINLTCKAAQEKVWQRKASFELFGADFILDENLHPWLIEVNTSPSLDKSTPATADLVSNTLEDVLKVVVDRRRARNPRQVDIGNFELSMRQQLHSQPLSIERLSCEGTFLRPPGKPNCGSFARVPGEPSPARRKERRIGESNPEAPVWRSTAKQSDTLSDLPYARSPPKPRLTAVPPPQPTSGSLQGGASQSTPPSQSEMGSRELTSRLSQREATSARIREQLEAAALASASWNSMAHPPPLPRITEKVPSPERSKLRSLLPEPDSRGSTTTTIMLATALVPKARISTVGLPPRQSSEVRRRASSKAGFREMKLSKVKIKIQI